MRYASSFDINSHYRLTEKGKYFEVRYFLNVIVGTSHTYVIGQKRHR